MKRVVIPVTDKEAVFMEERPDDTPCWAHSRDVFPEANELVDEMRRMHDKGGVNICVECVRKIKAALAEKLGMKP